MGSKALTLYLILPLTIILILVIFFLLSGQLKHLLSLKYQEQNSWFSFYTYHFVHIRLMHLLSNLIIFLLVYYLLAYLVIRGNEVMLFSLMTAIIFLVIAPALGVLALKQFNDIPLNTGYGFSGIVMAFTGLIPYFSFNLLKKELRIPLKPSLIQALFLLIGSGLSVFYIYFMRALSFILTGFTLLTLYLIRIYRAYGVIDSKANGERIALTGFCLSIFFFVVVLSFPGNIRFAGHFVDIYSHYMGLYLSMGFMAFLGLVNEALTK